MGLGIGPLWIDQAQAQVWLGTVDGNYHEPANWSTGIVPEPGNTAVFDTAPIRSVTVSVPYSGVDVLNFTPTADAYQITIAPNTAFHVETIDNQSANVQTFNLSATGGLGLHAGLTGPGKTVFDTSGGGAFELHGAATAAGARFIGGGHLSVYTSGATAIGSIEGGGFVRLDSGAAVELSIGDLNTDTDFSGGIVDSGAIRKVGTGTLTLSGDDNTFSGGTTISAGVLQIGNGGAAGSLPGNVVNNSVLSFNRNNTMTFRGAISGSGEVRQVGTGTVLLTGDSSSFSGHTDVTSGTLIVGLAGTGKLGGTLDVLSGGVLGGSGTIGTTTVASGGTIAPGNSIGTLNVAGNLILAAGSIYQVEIASNGGTDRISVSGAATVGGGHVQVGLLDAETSYQNGQTYTILTAKNGVSGQFTDPVTNSAFLNMSLDHKPNNVDLIIKLKSTEPTPEVPTEPEGPTAPKPLFAMVADTRNQFATAGALDTLAQSGPSLALYNQLLVLNADQARSAFDELSGEIHASAKTALIEDSRFVREAASDRVRAAFAGVAANSTPVMTYGKDGATVEAATTDHFAVWGHGFGSWGHASRGEAGKLDHTVGGFLAGADAQVFDTWRLGMLAGYSRSSFDVDDRHSSGDSDNFHLGLYGGTQWGNLGFRSGLAYTWHDISTNRSLSFPDFSNSLSADYNAATIQAFGELGYRIDTPNVSFEPFANLAHVRLKTDSFSESGGIAALSSDSDTINTTFSTLGVRASTSFTAGGIETTARGTLGWKHAMGDTTPISTHAFATGNAFTIAGVPIAKNSALIEAGLSTSLTPAVTLGLSYNGELASGARQHGLIINLASRF
ncbi:autotransporter domain-containing protein [Paraburkholderia aspalathi]|nr:autotransporter domain-containing protein [Paraburkholderia aspalathi]